MIYFVWRFGRPNAYTKTPFGTLSGGGPHSRQAKENIVKSLRQPPPFKGGFKGDVLFCTVAFCSRVHHHPKENIPLAPFKRGKLRNVLTR